MKAEWTSTHGSAENSDLEKEITKFGGEVFKEVRENTISLFNPEFFTGKLINWAMEDEEFRVNLFRFVDVLPSLDSSSEVIRHVHEYFQPVAYRIPGLLKWGLNIEPESVMAKATASIVKGQVRSMAKRFILGESPQLAFKALRKIRRQGMAFTVDILGEATVSEVESCNYVDRYCDLIQVLAKEVPTWKESSPIVLDHPGEDTPVNVSVKLSALYSQSKPVSFANTVSTLSGRLARILRTAAEVGAFVNVDMEDTRFTGITLETVKRVLKDDEFAQYDRVGLVFQTYLRRTEQDVEAFLQWLKKRGTPLTIRLVKGAYWDTETIQANLAGWPIPVWQEKSSSDVVYERITRRLLDHPDLVRPAFGSHNIRSLCYAIKLAEEKNLDRRHLEIQTLYGMADPIKEAFSSRGYLVREYAPIGALIPGMGYLVRRLLENTSNKGFIRQGFHDNESPTELLKAPVTKESAVESDQCDWNPRHEFRNCPLRDFSLPENRSRLQDALDKRMAKLRDNPDRILPVINGEEIQTDSTSKSVSPDNWEWVLAEFGLASEDQASEAIGELHSYFPRWRDTSIQERSEILFKTACILGRDRDELTAVIVLETGKPWVEADADLAEAIDFLNYYALDALSLFKPQSLNTLPGEDDTLFYEPRGVCAVIAPWNFPAAIPCGMFCAALVTGNCAILKPAGLSPVIASKIFNAFIEAGLPPQAAAFLPGSGKTVGARFVTAPRVSTIVFTGSKEVGLEIVSQASAVVEGQEHIKRVIAEMGGKNAIIIDADADLDQAVKGVLTSSFGYAGQKCSACSRVYAHENVYERFLERLGQATRSLVVGKAIDPATEVGPVIDQVAFDRLESVLEEGRESCRLVSQGVLPESRTSGWHIAPSVFADVPPHHPLLRKELFGPIVVVVEAKNFDECIRLAMDSEYGLTGAVFSRSPQNLRKAAREFRVGNLYLNRGSTGALVGRQPFGGARMSGVGSKAGGPDYLKQFVIPRAICENTMRQGFAPMDE